MSKTRIKELPVNLRRVSSSLSLALVASLAVSGCSSTKMPELSVPKSFSALKPKSVKLPKIALAENTEAFSKRVYAGATFGSSSLKPSTAGTSFSVADGNSVGSQLRIGIDLHNRFSLELDTAILGETQFVHNEANVQGNSFMKYSSASVSALFYGLTGVQTRSRREGWSGYGKIGYSLLKRSSNILPLDDSEGAVLLGLGAEYGFNNGMALRAEYTRYDSDADVLVVGGIYRFGMAPKQIGQVFFGAAKSAIQGESDKQNQYASNTAGAPSLGAAMPAQSIWSPMVAANDLDGDGVLNANDTCADTPATTTVNNQGCGLFDAVLTDVTFRPASSWLTPKARGVLDQIAETLLAFPEARIQVRAHTDSKGTDLENKALSGRRAQSVVTYLNEQGVNAVQLEAIGLGESLPIDSNDSAEGRRNNRRIELLTLTNVDPFNQTERDFQPIIVPLDNVASKVVQPSKKVMAAAMAAEMPANKIMPPKLGAANKAPVNADFPSLMHEPIEPLPRSVPVSGFDVDGILEGVEFVPGSSDLTDSSKPVLKQVKSQLDQFPHIKVAVIAHTDNDMNDAESQLLSMQQAKKVVSQLIEWGVEPTRLRAQGFGSRFPVSQNVTDEDRERNRRVELKVLE